MNDNHFVYFVRRSAACRQQPPTFGVRATYVCHSSSAICIFFSRISFTTRFLCGSCFDRARGAHTGWFRAQEIHASLHRIFGSSIDLFFLSYFLLPPLLLHLWLHRSDATTDEKMYSSIMTQIFENRSPCTIFASVSNYSQFQIFT